jgi:CotH kinase protein
MKRTLALYIIFLLSSLHAFSQSFTESTLPIVEINTSGLTIPIDGKIIATMEITFNGAGSVTHTSDIPNIWSGAVEIGLHGASSIGYPQKSYNFTTLLAGLEANISILDMPAEHDWILINNWNEKSFIRNTLAHKLFSAMGHYAVRQKHCEVTLNGQYIGIYLLSEKIKPDKGRVNISKLTETENTGAAVSGGYIIKNDIYDGSNGWASKFSPLGHSSTEHPYFLYEYPKASKITAQQKNYIKAFIDTVETSLYSSTFSDPVNGYVKYISHSSFMDYFILNELARNVDGNKKSSYWYKDRWDKGGKLHAGPVWDFDWAWKNIYDCEEYSRTDGSGWSYKIVDCPADVLSFGWFKRLLQDPRFANQIRCRWEDLRTTVLKSEAIFNYIDSIELVLAIPQQRHFAAFLVLGQNNGAPEVDAIPTTYHGEVVKLKNWITTRMQWLDANMPGTCGTITAIESSKQSGVTIYPNPGNGNFMISNSGRKVKYELYNSIGLIVQTGELEAGEHPLEIKSPHGLYFLRTDEQVLKVLIKQ